MNHINREIEAAWIKGVPVKGLDEEKVRHDLCGNLIYKDAFGEFNSENGWFIRNEKPIHWKNLEAFDDPLNLSNCSN